MKRVLMIFFVLLVGIAPTWAKRELLDKVGLVVNKDVYTIGEIQEALTAAYLIQGKRPPASDNADSRLIKQQVLQRLIEEALLSQEAERRGLEVAESELERTVEKEIEDLRKRFSNEKEFHKALEEEGVTESALRDDLQRKVKRQMQAARILKVKREELLEKHWIPEEQIRKEYEKNPAAWDEITFSAVFFRVPPGESAAYRQAIRQQAQATLKELEAGADFAKYAQKYSEDPQTARQGGKVGTFQRNALEPAFAQKLFALKPGGFGIVEKEDGVYVVRVDKIRRKSFEQAAEEIRGRLREEKLQEAYENWLKELEAKAVIRIVEK